MNKFDKGLYFVALGGADDIGMNMYAYCFKGKWIVVDAGYGFLNDDYPGMDMCYASPEFLKEFEGDIEGLFITHAHEDHMGAVAQVWPALKCPVYATSFAAGLITERLKEYKMDEIVPLKVVQPGDTVQTSAFEVKFVSLVHSVPQTCGLLIKCEEATVFHATDWRMDDGKLDMLTFDDDALKKAADEGLDMFVCDSTNVLLDHQQPSELDIRKSLIELIPSIEGGIVATCFASNIMRLESLVLAADKAGRTPVLLGRSLQTNVRIARECGYFKGMPQTYLPEEVPGLTSDKALYICTGSQANYRSALSLIAKGESKYVKLDKDYTVIFSSKIIPGNEDKIERMQEQMISDGVNVITEETALVHTSGHPSKDELKKMYELLKPKIVFPVHGDKRFIREHKRFASSCGVAEVCSGKNGDVFKLLNGNLEKVEEVFADVIGVDRGRSVSLSSELIKNRRRIAYNCSLFISAFVSEDNHLLDLEISSIDILEAPDWEKLALQTKEKVFETLDKEIHEKGLTQNVQDQIKARIRKEIFKATDIKPVVLLHIFKQGENQCQ
ncbi:MAG TPA: MBL fold hydrolase [Alphaproteobacteria bacterium]|nr:MBL fold hydrolase [Alphaproteobacteria bacterium]